MAGSHRYDTVDVSNLTNHTLLIRQADHCIDMIRETIMCSSDVTPITYYDNEAVPERRLPMPDFPTVHTCRNFEEILSWNNDNDRALEGDEIGLDPGDDSLPHNE